MIRIAVRAVMGAEPTDLSFLYFLTYVSAAGGLKYLVEATPDAAQEYTLEVGGLNPGCDKCSCLVTLNILVG